MNKNIILAALTSALLCTASSHAAVPYVFGPGTPISPTAINADFDAQAAQIRTLTRQVSALTARLDQLEGKTTLTTLTAADLTGDYRVNQLQSKLIGVPGVSGAAYVQNYASEGSATLYANGAGYMTGVEHGFDLTITSGISSAGQSAVQANRQPHEQSAQTTTFGWSYANGVVTLAGLSGSFTVVPGSKQLIGWTTTLDGTSALVILTRTN